MNTNKKVLIVDDNEKFCESVAEVLELEGYETGTAHDGFKAIEAVKEDGFDLVLMDVKMPVMDGVETFMKLKEISAETPVILMSAYAVEDRLRLALLEGAFGVFNKPLNFERLLSSIKNAFKDGALIMIVDDNEKLCSSLLEVMVENGYRGIVAKDGNSALQIAREEKFDVIIMDMKLPVMNGLETYMAIREIRPDPVVIIITGHKDEMGGLVDQALEKSAYACLEKPLDMDGLLETIRKGLEEDKTV